MGTSDTLRSVIDAGRSSKRLDELSSARVIGKVALQVHGAQQKAGAGKAVGPITPIHIKLLPTGEAKLELGEGGSLGYSSPEQVTGGSGDRRSDVFSLGAVLWEALTYQRLFDAMNDAAVRIAVQEREIHPPAELNANVPVELSAICMRALARNPSDRYQSLKSMAVEIEEFLSEAGYEDDDSKIAQYLELLHEPPKKVQITLPPLTRPASSTQPPPVLATPASKPIEKSSGTSPPPNVLKQPAAPTMLGEPPKSERAKRSSGANLAAALANAGKEMSGGHTAASSAAGPSQASFSATSIGVPKLDEWQDKPAPAQPAAAAPVESAVPTNAAPIAPLPPVLPSGSSQALRTDKSTIAVAVPPQVKVATTVDAKHVEAKRAEPKQPALLVDEKPKALIVDDAKPASLSEALASIDDGKATLVDAKPPDVAVPTLVDAKPPQPAKPADAEPVPLTPVKPGRPASASDATSPRASSHSEAASARAPSQSEATRPRSPSQSEATRPRSPSQSEATRPRSPSQSDAVPSRTPAGRSSPHPAAAIALGPIPGGKESKDVLAGWGWGTDKHNAIVPPDGYVSDDEYDVPAPDNKKTLMYVIGGGMALALLVTVIAFAAGGSNAKKKDTKKAVAKETEPSRTQVDPPPTPAPVAAPAPAAAAGPTEAEAAKLEAQQQAEAEKLAKEEAAKAEAAKVEAAKLEAQQKAEAEKLAKEEAAKSEAAKREAAKLEAQQKTEAARLAKEEAAKADAAKRETARLEAQQKAEAARLAKAEAAKAEAAKREAARLEAQKKAEAARLAKAEAAAKRAEAAKTEPKTPKTAKTTKTETKVAKAEPTKTEPAKTEGKLDTETAYRVGLQQFARGDTAGALASLRTSLAGNPNYAPTWRGLGLVFEKMGEKDQARAAYKRYLQLAPSAGDAEQIRGRLERLGS